MTLDKFKTIELENDKFLVRILNYGATIVDFIYKPLNRNVVKGYEEISDYYLNKTYRGATVGRVCNRLGNGSFTLNNKKYQSYLNDGDNSLHGGKLGFSFCFFELTKLNNEVNCSYLSKDMEEGYPGNLKINVNYKLTELGLDITYKLNSDKDTIASICNHSYFNLKGRSSTNLDDTYLKIAADEFAMIDEQGLSLPKSMKVENTIFDFREFKEISNILDKNKFEQLKLANGVDHHFIKNNLSDDKFIEYYCQDLKMEVLTTYPGSHVYTANFFEEPRAAICFECQFYPNAINYENRIKPVIKANKDYIFKTSYYIKENK